MDKNNKVHFAYAAPLALLSSNKTVTLPLDWDAASSSVVVTLPDLSFPLVIAFSISIPDAKGGFSFGFPSFKLGAKGEVEEESSGSDEEIKAKGKDKGKGKGGFEVGAKVPKIKVHSPSFFLQTCNFNNHPFRLAYQLSRSSFLNSTFPQAGKNHYMATWIPKLKCRRASYPSTSIHTSTTSTLDCQLMVL